MKKILILFIVLCLVACGEKKPQIEFKDENITIDMNEEYNLDDLFTVNDENAEYTVELDEENSKIIITLKTGEQIEKEVSIVPKKTLKFSELDIEKGIILLTSDWTPMNHICYDEKYSNYEGNASILIVENDTGSEADLKIEGGGTFGFDTFHISYNDATNIVTEARGTGTVLSEDGSRMEMVHDNTHTLKFKYIPYEGDINVKILAGSLRVRTSPSTSSETARNVKEGDSLISHERVMSEGYLWDRIGENEWIANGVYGECYVEYID